MEVDNKDQFRISGAITDGITDPTSLRALNHVELYYREIRKNQSDVLRIANHTGFTTQQILLIKNYLFIDEHVLDGRYVCFDESFEIAESWRRLAFDPEHIKLHDITLLNHVLMEIRLVIEGLTQDEAHSLASRKFNYAKESAEYYTGLQQTISHEEGQVGGAITYLAGNTH